MDDSEDLDLVMIMYNLIEGSSNYSEGTGSLSFYSNDKATNFDADIANNNDDNNNNNNNNNNNSNNIKSFEYKAKVHDPTPAQTNGILKIATIAVPLKYLSNFGRSIEMPLINYKVELKLKWTKYCVLAAAGNDNTNGNPSNIIFTIKDTKLYFPIVTLSKKYNPKLSKFLSKRFERSVDWNEYKTKSENKHRKNEYRCFLESNFVGVNTLFVLVYSN